MLWFGKQAKSEQLADDPSVIRPAKLAVEFDSSIASTKLKSLLDELDEFEGDLNSLLGALHTKQELMVKAFPIDPVAGWSLSRQAFMIVLSAVFPARRKLAEFFSEMDELVIAGHLQNLVYGHDSIVERMRTFSEIVPVDRKKERRAIWDLAAEILHFRDPEAIPLMTRWVWDEETVSGALREFIRGNDGLPSIPLDNSPETYEGARSWFADTLTEAGFYRDLPFLIDLLLAQAYADYVKAMSNGLGMVQAKFGSSQDPLEFVLRLLGVGVAGGLVPIADAGAGHILH
ncbi:hypothetical protein [Acidihalobacter ferrooxydans]|uniref:Uncharacterized protein n=1 Tax=Acidihalobacter ferrooxydans TaxID=1765967 RepID=A0A1P8UHS9_9GAMM|nr:hypothetical protein [Acidihalobacter ferrooxydans]APZ43369.1 hypothetical protein BW247_09920 [Acidihalobacter ferrooxydans]